MTRARASSISDVTERPIRPTRDPSIAPPDKFTLVPKVPGTKKLVLGEWVTVHEDDDDAAQ